MICQFLAQRASKPKHALKCIKMCFLMKYGHILRYYRAWKSDCFFFFFLFGVCVCLYASKITYVKATTGWMLVNGPRRERFHFLRNEPHSSPHIWLLCTNYPQWPNQTRFAHSFTPPASLCLFMGLITEPHTYILCFSFSSSLFPQYFTWL